MLLCYFTFVNSMGQFSTFVTKTPPTKGGVLPCKEAMR